jgi:hypothetical protein
LLIAGIFSTNGTVLMVSMVVTWVVFWGAFSAVVFGRWHRPAYWWLTIGILGPLGPIVALIAASAASRQQRNRVV